jgi:cell division protein FtsX
MLKHYIKVAFRNLWKYRNQTLVSVVGLATGFACFAMATLWIRYEMSYDSFHKNADWIYCVNVPNIFSPNGISRSVPYPLAGYLKATFPEIARATTIRSYNSPREIDGVEHKVDILEIDSSFFGMFEVKLVAGSMDFLIPRSKNIAITGEQARRLFGNESPLGKRLKKDDNEYTICAVVSGLPKRSNYPFDILQAIPTEPEWRYSGDNALVETVPDIDIAAFKRKLYEHKIQAAEHTAVNITLTPLTSVRYEDPNVLREVKFQHIILFAVAGSLLILCTLFNCLTLFISRFRIRRRELALRTVYGASGRSLFAMLSVEFIMSLIIALLLGMFFIRLALSPFRAVSEIKPGLSAIYLESVIYIAAIIVIALTAFLVTLAIFKRRTLNSNIRGNRKMFRKTSIVVQLIISIVFAFCTTVILKQMYHLHNTDLGFAFKNRGSIRGWTAYEDMTVLDSKIRQIPEIEEVLTGYYPLLPMYTRLGFNVNTWDGKQENDDNKISFEMSTVSEQYLKYYELKLIEGEMLSENDNDGDVLINESAAKAFGWNINEATGKSFNEYNVKYRVKGVLKNIYNMSPTVAAKPHIYRLASTVRDGNGIYSQRPCILFKYSEGSRKACMEKIRKTVAEEFPDKNFVISNAEEEYDKFLKSENTLLAILTVISAICLIVCVFGFVSMVSLTCEERRREIAIRKINGATVKDILDIFFREYLTLLAAGALVAFPAGYLTMKRWLENYVVQTEISAWIYVSILLALIMAVVLCVGGQVYRTSRENPINAIKN